MRVSSNQSTRIGSVQRRDQFISDGTGSITLGGLIEDATERVFNQGYFLSRASYTIDTNRKTLIFAPVIPAGDIVIVYYLEAPV